MSQDKVGLLLLSGSACSYRHSFDERADGRGGIGSIFLEGGLLFLVFPGLPTLALKEQDQPIFSSLDLEMSLTQGIMVIDPELAKDLLNYFIKRQDRTLASCSSSHHTLHY